MAIKHRIEKDVCIITTIGRRDSKELMALNKEIALDPTIKVMIFNFAETYFLDSEALGTLAFAYKEMLARSGHCLFCTTNLRLIELLTLLKLDSIPIYATEEAALASLK